MTSVNFKYENMPVYHNLMRIVGSGRGAWLSNTVIYRASSGTMQLSFFI